MTKEYKKFLWLRIAFKGLALFILAWTIWSAWPAFRYRPLQPTTRPLAAPYLKGSYHMHSKYSDGKGSISDLVRAAKQEKLDWILLTDHGNPNLGSENSGGWHDGVLLVPASELSTDAGHLVVIGSDTGYKLPYEPQLAIDELNERHGLTFVAHPFDDKIPWTDWNIHNFTGIEIFSVYESVKSAAWHKIVQFPLLYLIDSDYAILRVLSYPSQAVKQWNELNKESPTPVMGIFATDTHGRIPITRKLALAFPSYNSMFSSLLVYIPASEPKFSDMDARQASDYILTSIRKADYFNVIESIAGADGLTMKFSSEASSEMENKTVLGVFTLSHSFPRLTIRMYKDGALHYQGAAAQSFDMPITYPGRYRVELFLPDSPFADLPWVVGNPVDIPSQNLPTSGNNPDSHQTPALFGNIPPQIFSLEKNIESYGEILIGESGETLADVSTMRYSLRIPQQGRDSWCSLAVRDPEALQKFIRSGDGIYAEISASRRCTLWLEIRTLEAKTGREAWFRHSLIVDKETRQFSIPFSSMKQINGTETELSAASISALFLSINNSTAFIPAEGEITVYQLGTYRNPRTDSQP